jgi:hypothetical protein
MWLPAVWRVLILNMSTYEAAVATAIEHLPIQRKVSKDWCGYAIVEHNGGYHVYSADAWNRPTETPMLPWSSPLGTIVGYVRQPE